MMKEGCFLHTENKCCAIIAAAGRSSRMEGHGPKQWIPLEEIPVLARTLLAFESARTISSVVVVCKTSDIDRVRALLPRYSIQKVSALVSGGPSRQLSVAAGVVAAPQDTEFLAIHDGARPLTAPEEIDACVRDCYTADASALGVPIKDTVKIVDENSLVQVTPERSFVWAVQTPQVFRRSVYLRALEKAKREGKEYTDDCQLVEHLGIKVHLCRGSYENLKLTTEDDLAAAEAIIKRREKKTAQRTGTAVGLRIGQGYDVHRLVAGRRLILGGVDIPSEKGLIGHSDADVLSHAVMDALLGAATLGDIGGMFPDTDNAYRDADSLQLLAKVRDRLNEEGCKIVNIDSTVIAQSPKLSGFIPAMRKNLAGACGLPAEQVSVKATTEEKLGFTGSGAGIAAQAVCLIERI